jgi:hypothetical protein
MYNLCISGFLVGRKKQDYPILATMNPKYFSEIMAFRVSEFLSYLPSCFTSTLYLNYWYNGVLLRKVLPIPMQFSVFPIFSLSNLNILDITLRPFILFELILAQGERLGFSFSLLQMDIQFSQQYLLKRLCFLKHSFGFLCQNQVAVAEWVCVRFFCSIPLVCMSVLWLYHVIFITMAL